MSDKPTNPYRIKLENVRLSYVHVDKAYKGKEDGPDKKAKYSCSMIFDKSNKAHMKQIAHIKSLMNAIQVENKAKVGPDKLCLRDGNTKPDKEGYGDEVMFISASNDDRPQCVNRRGKLVDLAEVKETFYPGCVANVVITIWFQNNNYGKRVNASLECLQFVDNGERIGGAHVEPGEYFEDLGEGESTEDSGEAPDEI